MLNVSNRVLEVLSCHDAQLATHFQAKYRGSGTVESVTNFYCDLIESFPQPKVSISLYLQERVTDERRWFKCFDEEVIPLLKQNLSH